MSKFPFSYLAIAVATALALRPTLQSSTAYAASRTPLSSVEQAMLRHLEARETTFSLPVDTTNPTVVTNELEAALRTDTYLYLATRSYTGAITSYASSHIATFHVLYWEDATEYQAIRAGVKQVLKMILKHGMDDFAEEKAIHDYVVLCVGYDQSYQAYSAYDALYKRTAVCQGYAMLTYQLLMAAGIPNYIVIGTAKSALGSGGHAWNEVQLGGRWYQLDTTWDDPVPDVQGRVTYGYFNLTDAQLARDHVWSRAGLPHAITDYVRVLQTSPNSQDQVILKQTGLNAEEEQATYASFSKLQATLAQQKPGNYTFRFPYDEMAQLELLKLLYPTHWSYQRDARDPHYAVVVMTIS